VLATLLGYVLVYTVIFAFGMYYIYALLREGPTGADTRLTGATAMRPMAAAGPAETATGSQLAGS
jgi:cytochrome d ubiquinol oxidase subunit I